MLKELVEKIKAFEDSPNVFRLKELGSFLKEKRMSSFYLNSLLEEKDKIIEADNYKELKELREKLDAIQEIIGYPVIYG